MDLIFRFFLLISSFNLCLSAVVTVDKDNSIIEELMMAGATEDPFVLFSNERKQQICEAVLGSSYFQSDGLKYLEKNAEFEHFSLKYPHLISDHYDENDINECFAVRDQHIVMHESKSIAVLPSFGCLAENKAVKSKYREVFVSYARIKDTFIISLRKDPWSRTAVPEYIGIAEMLPSELYELVGPQVEEFFINDYNVSGNMEHRLFIMSPSRRNRICKIVINRKDNVKPEWVTSRTVFNKARVDLTGEFLVIDAVLPCTVFDGTGHYQQYLAFSNVSASGVYVLKQKDNLFPVTLAPPEYYLEKIPTLNEGYC